MEKNRFRSLFFEAVRQAQSVGGMSKEDEPLVEFYGKPNPDHLISLDEAFDYVWLSPEMFYHVVDVGVFPIEDRPSVVFVRLSGHEPMSFSETLDPAALGPFNVIGVVTRGTARKRKLPRASD